MADDSGRMEVFLQAIDGGARSQVSTGGGSFPRWRDDGREIVYLDPDRRLWGVPETPGTT
jgi:Tol biopolymer transport system component